MVTGLSVAKGIGYAATGIGVGYLWGAGWGAIADMGTVPFLNDFARFVSGLSFLGYLGGLGIGAYETFWSPDANPNPPGGPQGGAGGNAPNIRVYQRGNIRNRFGP